LTKAILYVLTACLALVTFIGTTNAHDASGMEASSHEDQLPPPWPYHFMFVFAGFISLAGGAFTARYLKQRKGWMRLHKNLALIGVSFVLMGLSTAAYMVSVYMGTHFEREMHAYLGASVFVFIIAIPILGMLQFRLKNRKIRVFHRWSGRVTILLMIFTIFAGIQMVLSMLAQSAGSGT
jgi:nitrate reductase gamma subunit